MKYQKLIFQTQRWRPSWAPVQARNRPWPRACHKSSTPSPESATPSASMSRAATHRAAHPGQHQWAAARLQLRTPMQRPGGRWMGQRGLLVLGVAGVRSSMRRGRWVIRLFRKGLRWCRERRARPSCPFSVSDRGYMRVVAFESSGRLLLRTED